MSSNTAEEPKAILIYGDSNTWGFNFDAFSRFPYHQRWTIRVQKALNESHPGKFHIIPEGVNGRSTIYDRTLDFEGPHNLNGRLTLPIILHSHKYLDLIVLALGTNDIASAWGPPEEASERCVTGIRELVKDVKAVLPIVGRGGAAKILVLGLPPLITTERNLMFGFHPDLEKVRNEANE